jgi:hypothetical protein
LQPVYRALEGFGQAQHQIEQRQAVATSAESFPRLALHQISHRRVTRLTLGYHQTKTGVGEAITPVHQIEALAAQQATTGKHGRKLRRFMESMAQGKTQPGHIKLQPARLNQRVLNHTQAMTALGATSADHGTTTTGAHTDEEAVGTLAANDGRLVSAFHGKVSLL